MRWRLLSSRGGAAAEPTVDAALEIGSLAVNPGDGTLLIGSTSGAFRLPAGAARPEKFRPSMAAAGKHGAADRPGGAVRRARTS